jgi:hypothetical protein
MPIEVAPAKRLFTRKEYHRMGDTARSAASTAPGPSVRSHSPTSP